MKYDNAKALISAETFNKIARQLDTLGKVRLSLQELEEVIHVKPVMAEILAAGIEITLSAHQRSPSSKRAVRILNQVLKERSERFQAQKPSIKQIERIQECARERMLARTKRDINIMKNLVDVFQLKTATALTEKLNEDKIDTGRSGKIWHLSTVTRIIKTAEKESLIKGNLFSAEGTVLKI